MKNKANGNNSPRQKSETASWKEIATTIYGGNNFLNRRRVNSVGYGTESESFLAPKIWDILKEIKNSETLNAFKAKIKDWAPQECPSITLQNICIGSRIYLRNNNTITIKLYISLSRLTSISFYFKHQVDMYVNIIMSSNKLLLFVWSTLKKKKKKTIILKFFVHNPIPSFKSN